MFAEQNRGNSQQALRRLLGRPVGMIGRELARGRQEDGSYCPRSGRLIHDAVRARCRRPNKLESRSAIYGFVRDHLLNRRWPPGQIEHRLRLMNRDGRSPCVVLCKKNVDGTDAVQDSLSGQMTQMPVGLRKGMTYDCCSKKPCNLERARRLKVDISCFDPTSPLQRGSNENTNELLRQFIPKGTDLGDASRTWFN
jgi:IS30 family transposase